MSFPHPSDPCAFQDTYKTVTIRKLHTRIHSVIADTPELQELGLGKRACMPNNSGMLFTFNHAEKYGFWMKDMHFGIDILWIGQDKKIVGIESKVSESSYPTIYYPPSEVPYVLELPSGTAQALFLQIGNQLSW